jgi:hypothetical protein
MPLQLSSVKKIMPYITGADPGGRTRRAPPLKLEKKNNWRKIVIFHTKHPNKFRASLRNWKKYDFLA